jgi:hypothetical protein
VITPKSRVETKDSVGYRRLPLSFGKSHAEQPVKTTPINTVWSSFYFTNLESTKTGPHEKSPTSIIGNQIKAAIKKNCRDTPTQFAI